MRTRSVVCLVLVIVLGAAASAAWAQAPQEAAVAMVNGQPITREALVDRLLNVTNIGRMVLEEMISEALLEQEAATRSIAVTDEEVKARIDTIKERLGGTSEQQRQDRFQQYLIEQNVTPDGLAYKVRIKLLAEKLLANEIEVTDQQVDQVYERGKSLYDRPETVVLRWIRSKTEADAKAVLQRLAEGEAFADVAKEVSTDLVTRQNGGLVGEMRRQDLPDELQEPTFSTEAGKWTTEPIKTKDGNYVILMVERKTPAVKHDPTFVREQIRMDLKERKLRQAWVELMDRLRKESTIENRLAPAEQ